MPLSTSPTTIPPSPLIKMEDRKRPAHAAAAADDLAPPSKRQAVNGSSKPKEDNEESWIEDYQKDAIYRQMLEYKRENATLETQLNDANRRAIHHDDHLRVINAWWQQLVQEVELLAEGSISSTADPEDASFPTSTQFRDIDEFESHLEDQASTIKDKVGTLLDRLASTRGQVGPDINKLEKQVNSLLANQKEFQFKLDQLSSDKESLSTQLDTATLRYMKAERKLDRLKSSQVQKLESQAMAQATGRSVDDKPNGTDAEESSGNTNALKTALKEASAVAEKHKTQLESALAQHKTLQEELTALQTRQTGLNDEDYSRTEVFKLFKAQHEDMIKRVNHLEAANKTLQTTNEQLQKEREASRQQVETDAQGLIGELEDQLQQADTNLVRIRQTRDDLHADLTMLKAARDQEKAAIEHVKELVTAKEERISSLESEIQRLKPSEDTDMMSNGETEDMTADELRDKYKKLMANYRSIESELPGMAKTINKFKDLANKKVMDFAALEDRVALLIAEKGKADQKYFSARKDADGKGDEIKRLRAMNSKSSDIISQLKEVEAQNRTLVTNLDKQLADLKQTNVSTMADNKKLESSSASSNQRYGSLKQQVADLSKMANDKDSIAAMAKERTVAVEAEVERLKVRVEAASKDRDKWKTKSLGNSSAEEEMLRSLALCSVCRTNFKNTMIKSCGHTFCRGCFDDRVNNRMRKCPTCSKPFDRADAVPMHL